MKTQLIFVIEVLLIVWMALPIVSFAQGKHHPINTIDRHQTFNSMEDVNGMLAYGKSAKGLFPRQAGHQTTTQLKSLIQIVDSVYFWRWDTLTAGWAGNPYQKIINIVYDANNNETSCSYQTWNGSAWVNYFKTTFTYDANNNQTNQLNQTWNGSAWVNTYKTTFTYDANNNNTSYLNQTWNGSAWVNFFK